MGSRSKKKMYAPHIWEHDSNYRNHKGEHRDHYTRFYDSMVDSPIWRYISGNGWKLYTLLKRQYVDRPDQQGGVVKCPYTDMLKNGFKSSDTISNASEELEQFGLIKVKKGGHNIPNEYRFIGDWKEITDDRAKQIAELLKKKRKANKERRTAKNIPS